MNKILEILNLPFLFLPTIPYSLTFKYNFSAFIFVENVEPFGFWPVFSSLNTLLAASVDIPFHCDLSGGLSFSDYPLEVDVSQSSVMGSLVFSFYISFLGDLIYTYDFSCLFYKHNSYIQVPNLDFCLSVDLIHPLPLKHLHFSVLKAN